MAVEAETWIVVLNALTEIAAIELEEGAVERALELVILCQQHPSTDRERRDQAESESQLTPRQIAAVEARAKTQTLENLVQEILAAR